MIPFLFTSYATTRKSFQGCGSASVYKKACLLVLEHFFPSTIHNQLGSYLQPTLFQQVLFLKGFAKLNNNFTQTAFTKSSRCLPPTAVLHPLMANPLPLRVAHSLPMDIHHLLTPARYLLVQIKDLLMQISRGLGAILCPLIIV
jgi:hypothetical protein